MLIIFEEPFLRVGFSVALISGVLCSLIGFFVILQKIVFIGVSIAQTAALGVVLGMLFHINPYLAAIILSLGVSLFFWKYTTEKDIPKDTIVALIYCFASAFAILLLSKNPRLETHGVNIIAGNMLYATNFDLIVTAIGGLIMFILYFFIFRSMVFVSYDRETALTSGIKANVLSFLFYFMLGIIISISMRMTGLLFVFGSLIIPVMTSFKIFTSIKAIAISSAVITALSILIGFEFSWHYDLPTAPLIVCIYSSIFLICVMVVKKKKKN